MAKNLTYARIVRIYSTSRERLEGGERAEVISSMGLQRDEKFLEDIEK